MARCHHRRAGAPSDAADDDFDADVSLPATLPAGSKRWIAVTKGGETSAGSVGL